MKPFFSIGLVFFILAFSPNSFAQTSSSNAASFDDSDALLKNFPTLSEPQKRIEILTKINTQGLSSSAANITAVRKALATRATNEEKIILIRIIGNLYHHLNKISENAAILRDLKGLTFSDDKDVARAATFAYSRTGYQTDTEEILLRALKGKVLSEDSYMGELSHVLPFAPKHRQGKIISILKKSRNAYSTDILSMSLTDVSLVNTFQPETQKALLDFLSNQEPNFPMAIGDYGFIDAIRYRNWLQSVAVLSEKVGEEKYAALIISKLNSPKTDERKVIAFLSSPYGENLMKLIGQRGPFETSVSRIRAYAGSFPQNTVIETYVNDIAANVSRLK